MRYRALFSTIGSGDACGNVMGDFCVIVNEEVEVFMPLSLCSLGILNLACRDNSFITFLVALHLVRADPIVGLNGGSQVLLGQGREG